MRYYSIVLTNPQTGQVLTPPGFAGLLGGATYTSYVNGQTLPAAWNVEMDLPLIGLASPQGNGFVRVWGISLAEIGQANNLGAKASGQLGMNITVSGGMQKGLPLANPKQAGVLFSGSIFQAYGNWIGTDMTLDMVVMPGTSSMANPGGLGTPRAPKNISLNWRANVPLSGPLTTALQTAFPGYTVNVAISPNIVRAYDQVHIIPTLGDLATFVRSVSQAVIKTAGYIGVTIVPLPNNVISVFDGTQAQAAQAGSSSPSATGSASASPSAGTKSIAFQDLIGQPTWIESPLIQVKTVMRADIVPGDQVTLPQAVVTNTAQANSSLINQQLAFQGTFTVTSGRHVGNYRQASADAWVTVFDMVPNNLQGT
jgi:hypothetical protein